MTAPRTSNARRSLLLVLAACLALSGCARRINLRGDNFADEYQQWGEKQREPDGGNGVYTFSSKAQQIEKNLGVR